MKTSALRGLFFAALAAALFVRLSGLSLRPMHHDEANQAIKFGRLLETGEYQYDQTDHHGPALYYLTLPLAYARGQRTLSALDEVTLRALPALFGAGMILLLLMFGPGLRRDARVLSACLIAVSPAMTYYSRFYIQETVFVFFSLGFLASVWRYLRRPDGGWALPAGIFAGLMAATKETAVIVFSATALGLGFVLIRERFLARRVESPIRSRVFVRDLVLAFVAAAGTAALFFSSFGKNPEGIPDSINALNVYVEKGISAPEIHAQSFFYYLGLLAGSKSGGIVWTEAFVLLLGLAGMAIVLLPGRIHDPREEDRLPVDRSLGLFLAVSTIASTLGYSILSYKTPWNVLPFYLGWLVLAGIGGTAILRTFRPLALKAVVFGLLAAGLAHLGWQNHRANFRYPADPRNPYVYAQTSPDFMKLVRRIENLSALHPAGKSLIIKVIAGPYEQWPLPWSLRKFERVGYWTGTEAARAILPADLVIASADRAEAVQSKLGESYQAEYFGLRPDVLLVLFIPRDLRNRYPNTGPETSKPNLKSRDEPSARHSPVD
jgi:uncharacterized protein (TIGR03663 family)